MRPTLESTVLVLALTAVALSAVPPETGPRRYSFSSFRMGTRFDLVLYATGPEAAAQASRMALDRIAELEAAFSDYREDSELRRLERAAFESAVAVSPDLFSVLRSSLHFARLSEGAFDPTVGALTRLWRESARIGHAPSPERAEQARRAVDHRMVRLDEASSTVRFLNPGVELDLGGIAKGYAADRALDVLKGEGIVSALIDAGGDIVVSGPPPGKAGWRIAIETLDEDGPRLQLTVKDRAIATSGTTLRVAVLDGVPSSHLQDPADGAALGRPLMTTVLAPDGVTADALATAFSVMPPERAIELADRLPGVCVRLQRIEAGRPVVQTSDCFPADSSRQPTKGRPPAEARRTQSF